MTLDSNPMAAIDAALDAAEPDVAALAGTPAPEPNSAAAPAPAPAPAPEPNSAAPSQSPDPSTTTAPAPQTPYQQWLAQYGGDPEKAGAAAWETNNRAAAMARRVAELEKAQQAQVQPLAAPAQPTAPTPVAPPPAEIAKLDESLRDIVTQAQTITTAINTVRGQYSTALSQIDVLTRAIGSGEVAFDQLEAAQVQLQKLLKYKDSAVDYLTREQGKIASLRERFETTNERKAVVGELLQIRDYRAAQAREVEDAKDRAFVGQVIAQVPTLAKEGEPIPQGLLGRWDRYAKREFMNRPDLRNLEIKDIIPALQEIKTDFLALVDESHRVKSGTYGTQKQADTAVAAPVGKAAVAPPDTRRGKFQSRDEAQAHIDAQLGL